MKNLLKLRSLAIIIGLSMCTFPLFAQQGQGQGRGQGQGPGMRGMMSEEAIKERVNQTAETLDLSEDQKKQMLKIELDFFNKMQSARPNFEEGRRPSEADFAAMRENMQKMRTERDEKYKAVLTEAQMAKYNKLMEERRQRMQEQRGGPPGQRIQQDTTRAQRGRGRGN